MNVLGHGIDIVDLNKIEQLANDSEGDFVSRCFTQMEQSDSGNGTNRIERLAGRFAAKEAVLKALGIGWSSGIAWTDVELQKMPSGAPKIILHGRVAEIAEDLGINDWLISTSHSDSSAVASVIALSTK